MGGAPIEFDCGNTVSLAHKLAGSPRFKTLFRDGMDLVEEVAAYLDGPGRDEAKQLPRPVALAYAAESMRLTTRLMQLASWLLVQRAVNEKEMTQAQAAAEKHKVRLSPAGDRVRSRRLRPVAEPVAGTDRPIAPPAGPAALSRPLDPGPGLDSEEMRGRQPAFPTEWACSGRSFGWRFTPGPSAPGRASDLSRSPRFRRKHQKSIAPRNAAIVQRECRGIARSMPNGPAERGSPGPKNCVPEPRP